MSVQLSINLKRGYVTTGAMREVTKLENYLRFCRNSRGMGKAQNIHATVKFRGIADDFISSLVQLVSSIPIEWTYSIYQSSSI